MCFHSIQINFIHFQRQIYIGVGRKADEKKRIILSNIDDNMRITTRI